MVQEEEDLVFLEAADYSVSAEDRLAFERNGHVATRGVFSSEQLKALRPSVVRGEYLLLLLHARQSRMNIRGGHNTVFPHPPSSLLAIFVASGVVRCAGFSVRIVFSV